MPASKHGPGITNPKVYEELREDGASKEKAARIANARRRRGRRRRPGRQGRRLRGLDRRQAAQAGCRDRHRGRLLT